MAKLLSATTDEELEQALLQVAAKPWKPVDPGAVIINNAGFAFRELFVRLPDDAIFDHINSRPDMWAKVQQNSGKALKKFDRVFLVAWDEAWMAEAVVTEASARTVVFATPRKHSFPERNERLLNDGCYRVVWVGTGYGVYRNRDNVMVSGPHPNAVLAERALGQQYPQPT